MPNPGQGKVALVTGSGKRRVGNVVARRLADRGYAVALHYRRSADEAQETVDELTAEGARARAFGANVADEADVKRLFAEVAGEFGRLDVLVAVAAVWEPKPLESVTADDVRRQFEVNTLGTFLCCQRAGLLMVEQPEGGAIVTIGDWATVRPYPGYAAYFPSKGAIPTLTRCLAVELARRNPRIRVNCILPGPVMLPEDLPEEERHEAMAGTLLHRLGSPENIAHAVVFLVENDFVTGVCLPVDGGRTIAGG
ncbi:MAG: SDR family NAD(P)-dependent oxidoreductase [Planctomycetia bacterium]|nr:SDR family NAD(P)-dependent oxidoreductase [Planctomycetia bacterium]